MNTHQQTGDTWLSPVQSLAHKLNLDSPWVKHKLDFVMPMGVTIIRELLLALALLFGVSLVVFTILYAAPGDSFSLLLSGERSASATEEVAQSLGFSNSWFGQYSTWLINILHGDLGTSIRTGQSVFENVVSATINTLNLTLAAMLVTLIIAYPIAIYTSVRSATPLNGPLTIFAYVISALPLFWLAYIGIFVSTNVFDYFPLGIGLGVEDDMEIMQFLLPVLILGIGSGTVSEVVRFLKLEISRVLEEEYIRTAKAKGASIWRHGFKEGLLLPTSQIISSKIPFFLGGAIIVEQVFNWPGMGRMAWQAAQDRDFPVIMGIALAAAILVRLGSLVHRMIYIIVNPRASHE
ncbi:MAG: ABC transporter permease [Gammaproteobacteria bacterium]|nr:ABC transporter permease [Gammaproteobacteria bacterium]